mmetsp:Transcript_75168/g.199855  ORF Transcript_75168/g.199855 Transcript_75168/m.199855 type:complete len:205 (+) Transcript_75168:228-842(+)
MPCPLSLLLPRRAHVSKESKVMESALDRVRRHDPPDRSAHTPRPKTARRECQDGGGQPAPPSASGGAAAGASASGACPSTAGGGGSDGAAGGAAGAASAHCGITGTASTKLPPAQLVAQLVAHEGGGALQPGPALASIGGAALVQAGLGGIIGLGRALGGGGGMGLGSWLGSWLGGTMGLGSWLGSWLGGIELLGGSCAKWAIW